MACDISSVGVYTSRMQASGERRCVVHTRLRLYIVLVTLARLYLHCGISHWADI